MQEFFTRVTAVIGRVIGQAKEAFAAADAQEGITAVLNVVLPAICGILRIAAIVFAILIVVRCVMSILREKTGKEIWGWLSLGEDVKLELHHWENTIGRAKRSDVTVDVPTVSRSHAALLRDARGNWKIKPLQTKNGTKVNGRRVGHTVPIRTGDIIDLGGLPMEFHAISESEEREQAMRSGVAERPLSPGRTLAYLTIFQLLMCVQCLPGHEAPEMTMIAGAFALLPAAMWILYGIYRSLKRTAFEAESLAFLLCTISFGITAAYSPTGLIRQAICMVLGIVVFLFLSVLLRDIKTTVSLRWPVAVLTCLLLIFNVVLGERLFGAKNWIHIGPINFQPSEFVKIAFIFTGAATLDRLFARRNLIFTVLFCGFCMGSLALMSDFGTALIFFVGLLVIAFLRSGDLGFLALMGTAAVGGGWTILHYKPYIANRFSAWRHVWEYSNVSGGYQQTRTMSAIASGGLFGKGTEDSFLKNIGAANTDLVFGVISEEFGLILALCAVAVILVLAVLAVRFTATARSSYYVIAANAAASMMIFQTALNVLGAVDILPITGVTLPFVSIGGSSMIACWGFLAFLKAADTRPNASFTLKLPKKIRGWIPSDAEQSYSDFYDEGYDDGEGYKTYDSYENEDTFYDGPADSQPYSPGPERGYDAYDSYPPRYSEDYDDPMGWAPPPGQWEDYLDGPLWPEDEDPRTPPPRRDPKGGRRG